MLSIKPNFPYANAICISPNLCFRIFNPLITTVKSYHSRSDPADRSDLPPLEVGRMAPRQALRLNDCIT